MQYLNTTIYLDTAFIVDLYRRLNDFGSDFDFVLSHDAQGASLKERFSSALDTQAMYEALGEPLGAVPTMTLDAADLEALPELFWVEGILGTSAAKTVNEEVAYHFMATDEDGIVSLYLASNPLYFATGYDQILAMAPNFTEPFSLRTRMLLKFLANTPYHTLCAPMVIVKRS